MLAALFINVLSLSGLSFSMQVYDRVIPAQSCPTLYVVTIRCLSPPCSASCCAWRAGIMDLLGKRSDLRVSDRVSGHALGLQQRDPTLSHWQLYSQLRELEQIRERWSLSTISTIGRFRLSSYFRLWWVLVIIAPAVGGSPGGGGDHGFALACCCRRNWRSCKQSADESTSATRCQKAGWRTSS
ncbi:hypothetical protein KIF59_14385 [Enterobacter cloacae subsp. cloacae]|nr:hypothetical protein [Enterobacter cloacae subsp. cloacae]